MVTRCNARPIHSVAHRLQAHDQQRQVLGPMGTQPRRLTQRFAVWWMVVMAARELDHGSISSVHERVPVQEHTTEERLARELQATRSPCGSVTHTRRLWSSKLPVERSRGSQLDRAQCFTEGPSSNRGSFPLRSRRHIRPYNCDDQQHATRKGHHDRGTSQGKQDRSS